MSIKYRECKYKYQLVEDVMRQTNITGFDVSQPFFYLKPNGMLGVRVGYSWDGPSGPTLDTKDALKPSLYHDVLYQMIRKELLPLSCKEVADELFYVLCIENGMLKARANIWYQVLQSFGRWFCDPESDKEDIKEAP
jgi:hypothetical protein